LTDLMQADLVPEAMALGAKINAEFAAAISAYN
jgi:hypothetical protein